MSNGEQESHFQERLRLMTAAIEKHRLESIAGGADVGETVGNAAGNVLGTLKGELRRGLLTPAEAEVIISQFGVLTGADVGPWYNKLEEWKSK